MAGNDNRPHQPVEAYEDSKTGQAALQPGQSIFVLEDEFLLAHSLAQELRNLGYAVVGPYAGLAAATEASRRESFDLAILDININGEKVYPLAEELIARGRPVLLLSGYGQANLPEQLRLLPRLAKPYDPSQLRYELRRLLGVTP